ncbi:hypothetical protein KIPB_012614, partial [Kipferlia bialata]
TRDRQREDETRQLERELLSVTQALGKAQAETREAQLALEKERQGRRGDASSIPLTSAAGAVRGQEAEATCVRSSTSTAEVPKVPTAMAKAKSEPKVSGKRPRETATGSVGEGAVLPEAKRDSRDSRDRGTKPKRE